MKIQEIVTHHQKWQWQNKKIIRLLLISEKGDQYGCLSLFKSFIHSRPFE